MAHKVEASLDGGEPAVAELQLELEHLCRALMSRDVIGEAFALLVHASQHANVRVAELSAMLAETGEWAGPAPE